MISVYCAADISTEDASQVAPACLVQALPGALS